ncbi:MAG: hypothetical protein LBB98_13580 [Treponema sp.]|jgi:hypothetical protein|nr:hypothetical protein [Treponema sp.]
MDKSGKQQNHCAFGIEFLKKQAFFIALSSLLLGACGIEDYPYLEPVREGNISWELNVQATIFLPYITSQQFTHFLIYYRIYISDESILSNILPDDMSKINSTLYQDYTYILPYINTDNTSVSTQIGTLFSNRKYYSLFTESSDLNDLLSSSVMGQRIVIDFSQTTDGRKPTIEISGTEYVLWRTTGRERGEIFEIKPDNDRSFINTSELNSSEYADSKNVTVNNDVVDKTVSGSRYTYVSMYIVSTGHDLITYSPIYSQPAFIGVFCLPEP